MKNIFLISLFMFMLLSSSVYAADIKGYVIDDKNNLIAGADVRVYCGPDEFEMKTDKFGFFVVYDVMGECKIIVISDGLIKTSELYVEGTDIYVATIVLESSQNTRLITTIIATATFLIIALVTFLLLKRYILKTRKDNETELKSGVKETLIGNEKIIVDQLCKGPLTHSQLRHYTGLPKSTIHRVLNRLEARSVVSEFDDAGVKKWELSDTVKKW